MEESVEMCLKVLVPREEGNTYETVIERHGCVGSLFGAGVELRW